MMHTMRFNVTVDWEIGRILRGIKNKSRYITEALKEKLEKEKRQKKLQALQKAYQASAKEDRTLVDDWDSTLGDGL